MSLKMKSGTLSVLRLSICCHKVRAARDQMCLRWKEQPAVAVVGRDCQRPSVHAPRQVSYGFQMQASQDHQRLESLQHARVILLSQVAVPCLDSNPNRCQHLIQ